MARRKNIPRLAALRMVKHYAEGESLRRIALRFGISYEAVRYHLLKEGVVLRGQGVPPKAASPAPQE